MRLPRWKPFARHARESFLHHSGLRGMQFRLNRSRLSRSVRAGRTHIGRIPGTGVRLIIDPRMYLKRAYCGHLFEHPVVSFMKDWLQRGDTFVDVGANVGLLSLVGAGCVGEKGHVAAFEPGKFAYELLKKNSAENGCDWIETHNSALGSTNGSILLNEGPPGMDTYSSVGDIVHPGADGRTFDAIRIPVIAGASWWQERDCPRLRLIKIDVEGAEYGVLQGFAPAFEAEAIDGALVEITESMARACGNSPRDVWEAMISWGYTWFQLEGYGRIKSIERFDPSVTDYLALSRRVRAAMNFG